MTNDDDVVFDRYGLNRIRSLFSPSGIKRALANIVGGFSSKESALKRASSTLLVKVAGGGLSITVQIILARTMGLEQFGTYILVLNGILLLAIFSNLGLHIPIIRFVATYKVNQQFGLLRGVIVRGQQYVFGVSLLVTLGLAGAARIMRESLSDSLYSAILFGCGLLPIMALLQIIKSIQFGFKRPDLGLLPELVIRHFLTIVFILFFSFVLLKEINPSKVLIMVSIAGLVSLVFSIYYLKKSQSEGYEHSPEYDNAYWYRTSLPFLLVAASELIMSRTDVLILGYLRPESEVGIFASAASLATIITMLTTSSEAVMSARFAEMFSMGLFRDIQKKFTKLIWLLILVIFPLGIGLISCGNMVLLMFGKDFTGGTGVLSVLVLTQLYIVFMGPLGLLMGMTGQQKTLSILMLAGGILNVILCFTLIPLYGPVGAALARMIVIILLNCSYAYVLWIHIKIIPTVFAPLLIKLVDPYSIGGSKK